MKNADKVSCRKCGKNPIDDNLVLKRVNKKGVKGVWECSPNCGNIFCGRGDAILHALGVSGAQ